MNKVSLQRALQRSAAELRQLVFEAAQLVSAGFGDEYAAGLFAAAVVVAVAGEVERVVALLAPATACEPCPAVVARFVAGSVLGWLKAEVEPESEKARSNQKKKRPSLLFIHFISIFILLTRRKATEALIHRVSDYPTCFRRCQDILLSA